jgi:hypothetical protein
MDFYGIRFLEIICKRFVETSGDFSYREKEAKECGSGAKAKNSRRSFDSAEVRFAQDDIMDKRDLKAGH